MFKSGAATMEATIGTVTYIGEPEGADPTPSGGSGPHIRLHLAMANTRKSVGRFSPDRATWQSDKTAAKHAATTGESHSQGPLTTAYKPGEEADGEIILDVGSRGGLVTLFDVEGNEAPLFRVRLPA